MAKAEKGATSAAAYRVGRELGKRVMRSFAAIREPNELVVVQRFAAGANPKLVRTDGVITLGVDAMNQLLRDADCLARNWHPNVARVKHVDGDAMKLAIATDFVDGMTLGELFARGGTTGPLLPYPVIVRVLVDVLAGLTALHALRDGTRAAGTIHGALSPANIVVGRDGVARIISCLRPRPVRVMDGAEALPYAAPEALDEGGTKDARSDVYAVGVILWHALVGKAPYEATDPVQLLARQREEEVAAAHVDASSPFLGLSEIAARAMAFEPSLRYRTTAEMAAALRKLAGAEIGAGTAVAAKVAELAGDRIRARRAELDPKAAPPKRKPAVDVVAPIAESTPALAMDVEPAPITARGEADAKAEAQAKARAKAEAQAKARAKAEAHAQARAKAEADAKARAKAEAPPVARPRVKPVVVAAPAVVTDRETLPALVPAMRVVEPERESVPALIAAMALPDVPAVAQQAAPPPPSLPSVIVAPTSSAPVLAAAPVAPPSSSPLLTPAAVFRPSVEPPSLSASEAPPPRRRKSRAVVLLLLGAALTILLVAGVRSVIPREEPAAPVAAGAPSNREPPAAPAIAGPTSPAVAVAIATAGPEPAPVEPPVAPVVTSGDVGLAPPAAPPVQPPVFNAAPRPAIKKKTYDPLGI